MKRLGIAVSILVVALVGSLLARVAIVESEDPLVVVHWSNSHPMREGLLEDMAESFNEADHETGSGQPIEIKVIECDSADQVEDLVARVTTRDGLGACEDEDGEPGPDPTIVTPQSDDWFVFLNNHAGSTVVDPDTAKPIAEAYLGIVTNRKMADCLRSSGESIGYADILELAERGWSTVGCDAKSSWGTKPRLSFTNPSTSTSGRNVLVTLYAMYAGDATGPKALEELSVEDVARTDVQAKVQGFQAAVDHYMPGTLALNTMIADKEADFFLLPEDNVVSLFKGLEEGRSEDGTKERLEVKDLAMIYPEEGSVLNSNPAGIVDADWVERDELAAANTWIDYLREETQQRDFMAAGFRPAADTGLGLKVEEQDYTNWGLDAAGPDAVIDPADLKGEVLDEIIGSWGAVKKPSVVTFVVDLSDSMFGDKLAEVREGLGGILDEMEAVDAESTQVGLVTFGSSVDKQIPPDRLGEVGAEIGDAITAMEADRGQTALYDAVKRAIELTDDAAAAEGATRAVVVLSDGVATTGDLCLHDVVGMSADETDIARYCANTGMAGTAEADAVDKDGNPLAVDEAGQEVSPDEVEGDQLAIDVVHDDLDVFFVGFGSADINVGRILAGATKADFQKSTDDGLAAVIQALSGYF